MIRFANTADIPAITNMAERMMASSSFNTLTFSPVRFSELCEALISNGFALVAERDNKLIGGLLADAVKPWYSMDLIGIDYGLYIEPEHRSGMLAAKMVKQFENWCDDMEVKQIRLGISTGDLSVSKLYQALGYVSTGELFLKDI